MRTKQGTIVSAKQEKTVVVRVNRYVSHPKYHKRYLVSKKFHVHDESGKLKEGDAVTIMESSPISKLKRWRVIDEVKKTTPPVAEKKETAKETTNAK